MAAPTSASESNSWAKRIYAGARDIALMFPPTEPAPIITPAIAATVVYIVKQLPEGAQTVIAQIANTTNSTFSNVQELGQSFLEESLKAFNPLKTTFSWEPWGCSFLPTSVKISLVLLTSYAAYRVLFAQRRVHQ